MRGAALWPHVRSTALNSFPDRLDFFLIVFFPEVLLLQERMVYKPAFGLAVTSPMRALLAH